MKETLQTAVRMVGHLLEHNGVTGPYAVDKDGNSCEIGDPRACGFCMAASIDLVATTLGIHYKYRYSSELTNAVLACLGTSQQRVIVWEGYSGTNNITPVERLKIVRRLQACGSLRGHNASSR